MGISKITRNFQVALPRDVRELKRFKVGDKVLFVVEGEHVGIIKMDKEIIGAAAGLWDIKEDGLSYVRRIRNEWEKREVRGMQ